MAKPSLQNKEQVEALKKLLFLRILDDGARNRLNNIRVANPEFAAQLEMVLLQTVQQGTRNISESQLIAIINQMRGQKRATTIRRL